MVDVEMGRIIATHFVIVNSKKLESVYIEDKEIRTNVLRTKINSSRNYVDFIHRSRKLRYIPRRIGAGGT